ncbi:MAG: DegT/DnrJ/EryC1/StrS family aminotransferase [Myxococcales bacterium]|nr:DegT/DnrJ/EryC1/StrS family aminotransferase [Myxococcales bacterium]
MSRDDNFIPITEPWFDEHERQAVLEPIDAGWVLQGPRVAEFEREFSNWVGAQEAVAVSSGTAALHVALLALGIGPGDEVITVSHSFVATANAIALCGAKPIFCDIDERTYNLDVEILSKMVTEKTSAIMVVHQLGMPCDLAAVREVAARHNLPVIEDAACAIGSEVLIDERWERIGKPHGVMACFSFHPRKLLTTGDGGMVTTSDRKLAARLRLLRNHGMESVTRDPGSENERQEIEFRTVAHNYRLTDLQAALGLAQLRKLPAMVEKRRAQRELYDSLLEQIPGVSLPEEPSWARSNWQSYCVLLPERANPLGVIRQMNERGVSCRGGIVNAHQTSAYQDRGWGCSQQECPRYGLCPCLRTSERVSARGLMLPMYHAMSEGQQRRVVAELEAALANPGEVSHG